MAEPLSTTDQQAAPPPNVAEAAASQQLGSCVMSQQGAHPIGNFFFGLMVASVLFGIAVLVDWIIGSVPVLRVKAVAFIAFLCVVFAIIMIIKSLAALAVGFTATYLYDNGLIHTKNRRIQTVTWSQVDKFLLWRAGGKTALAGTLLCYYLVTFDGRKIPIEARAKDGNDDLGNRLQEIIGNIGRQVVESGPYSGRLRP